MTWFSVLMILTVAGLIALGRLRSRDVACDKQTASALFALAGEPRAVFEPDSVRDLPEPARRYFQYTIEAGAALTG